MNKNNSQTSDILEIRLSFVVILIATLAVLIGLVIGLFIVMSIDDQPSKPAINVVDNLGHEPEQTGESTTSTEQPDETDPPIVNVNTTPLFPTQATRESYKIATSEKVVTLNSDGFIKSNNTILVKLEDGAMTSILEKNADTKMYPASMTKVMTLIVACERVTNLDKKLAVTQEIAQFASDQGGSGAGLKVGDSYTVEDLLYLIAYQSDTIASILIAQEIAGSEEAFVALMNEKVAELGLEGTHFANCTGLYNENNYSTCRDIASIMAYALDNEMAYKCLSSYKGRSMVVGGVDCTFYSAWYSVRFKDNPKLKNVTVKAAKTGYIDESGMSLVSYATDKNGNKFINVIVGKPKGSGLSESISTSEVKSIYNTYAK